MLYTGTMGWNTMCTHNNIHVVFSVGLLVYSVTHNIYLNQFKPLSIYLCKATSQYKTITLRAKFTLMINDHNHRFLPCLPG
jgi:hypothetical protein